MKRIIVTFLLLLVCFSGFAFDFGGIVSSTSYVQDSVKNISFNQYVESSLWFRTSLGKNTSLSGDIFYSFNGDFSNKNEVSANVPSVFINKLDLSSLKLTSNFTLNNHQLLKLTLGRFLINDFTGYIFAQKIDSLALSYITDILNLNFFVGYTGLLNNHIIKMYSPTFVSNESPLYTFACPYIVANVSAKFPVLFAAQNFGVELYTALDAKQFEYNRLFATLALDGPIYKSIYYALTSTFQFNLGTYPEKHFWGNFTKAEISWFTGIKSLIFSANTIYVSDSFTPISTVDILSDGTNLDSVLKTGVLVSFKPVNPLFVLFGTNFVFDVAENNGIQDYKGFQYITQLRYQIFDDALACVSAEQIFYNNNNSIYEGKDSHLTVKAHLRISF